jgi:Lrp/AsnC family transcriptional regulator for asnA, asnC and gidA
MGKVPDRIDLQIIETLRRDGRTPNKSIAKLLNVSETTIASRIRAMTERNVMRVTLQRDIYSLGYQFQGFLDLYVAVRSVGDVAKDVGAIDGVLAIAVYLGSPDILVSFGARDREDLSRIITDEIAKISGIERLDSYVALQIRKFESSYVALGEERHAN